MNQDQQIRAKALEIAAMIIGHMPSIGTDSITGVDKPITEESIKKHLDLALLFEQQIRKS